MVLLLTRAISGFLQCRGDTLHGLKVKFDMEVNSSRSHFTFSGAGKTQEHTEIWGIHLPLFTILTQFMGSWVIPCWFQSVSLVKFAQRMQTSWRFYLGVQFPNFQKPLVMKLLTGSKKVRGAKNGINIFNQHSTVVRFAIKSSKF